MKARIIFYLIPFVGISAISCSSTRPLMDDDIYVMKTADVPIGEDLLDETSYSTYVYRLNEEIPTNGYYDQSNSSVLNGSSWFMYGRFNNLGTNASLAFNPYWAAHRNGFYYYDNIYGMSGFGYSYGPGYFNNYGQPYSYYNGYTNFYGNNYGYNSQYYGNGFYSNNYCFTGLNTNAKPSIYGGVSTGNHVSGPRASQGGYGNVGSRGGAAQLKSQSTSTASNYSAKPIQSTRPVSSNRPSSSASTATNRQTTAKPQYTRNGTVTSQTTRQSSTTRPANNSRTTNTTSGNTSTRPSSSTSTTTRTTPRSTNTSTGTSGGRSGGSSGGSGSSGGGRSGGRCGN
jgi:hypothetical protein